MRWPSLPPSGGDVAAILLGLAIVGACLISIFKPTASGLWAWRGSAGFGPDWECAATPVSEQVCIKRVPASSPNRAVPSN